jgi:membrane protease YdiL (CAAX protease family)
MQSIYTYRPISFFLITFLGTWIPWFIGAYFSHQKGKEKWQMLLMLVGLLAPFIVALIMIYGSKNGELIKDFWNRLWLYRIQPSSLIVIVLVIPALFFLATAISLFFGKSTEQFTLAKEFSVLEGWGILGVILPFFMAPVLEELGWRGYGVDSLRAHFNLFSTSMLFALLWGLWHLPLFFAKVGYHHDLWSLNIVYVLNFFISIIPMAIIINWVYYNNSRSILIAIFVHSAINILSIVFKTEQLTKCIFTLLLCALSAVIVIKDKEFFFSST